MASVFSVAWQCLSKRTIVVFVTDQTLCPYPTGSLPAQLNPPDFRFLRFFPPLGISFATVFKVTGRFIFIVLLLGQADEFITLNNKQLLPRSESKENRGYVAVSISKMSKKLRISSLYFLYY
jgi:hypothetical protein